MAKLNSHHIIICEQAKNGMEVEIERGKALGNEDVFNYHKSELKSILPFVDRSIYTKYAKYMDISFE